MQFSKSLFSLFGLPRSPADAKRQFNEAFASSELHLWSPGDSISEHIEQRLLVCVATWSPTDLELLDNVNNRLRQLTDSTQQSLRIDVFDVDVIQEMSQFSEYYPNVDLPIVVTPVAGLWINGRHDRTYVGEQAVQLLQRVVSF